MGRSVTRGLSALVFSCCAFAQTKPFAPPVATPEVAHERPWLLLGHWEKTLRGYRSDVNGPGFFLSPHGRRDPLSELRASIDALFASPNEGQAPDLHFSCQYPARTRWILERFSIPRERIPAVSCRAFEDWFAALGHDALSLVFASYYVNNPASMFGHTFLRLDSKDPRTSDPLLSYSVNFAANTGDDNGILFAFKGIAGSYPGQYSTYPYYLKVLEYNNAENRVLWEYPMGFTADEIDRLVRHLWELGRSSQSYYFFDKNCSYQLLALLEVARPSLDLRSGLSPAFVPPADTVKVFAAYPGLLGKPIFRPSVLLDLRHRLASLTRNQKRLLRAAIRSQEVSPLLSPEDPAESARMLDAAIALMEYRNRHPIQTEYQKRILVERSGFPPSDEPPLGTDEAPPDQGHDSARVSLGGGVTERDSFVEWQIRPVFHDLLSDERAYPKRSEIVGLDLVGRYAVDGRKVSLERATLVQVLSLFPVERFLVKPSWSVSFGFETLRDDECASCLHSYVRLGTGLATSLFGERLTFYGLAGAQAQIAPWNDLDIRLSPRAESGMLFSPSHAYAVRIFGVYSYAPWNDVSQTLEGALEQRVSLSRNVDLRLTGLLGQDRREGKLLLGRYF